MAAKYRQFKVGEVVILKSGGFPMTVTQATNHEGNVQTSWFSFNGLCADTFPAEALDVTKLRYDVSKNAVE